MHALILCGGLGIRLRSILGDLPKPMAPVAGKPFLEYILLKLRRHQFTNIVLCNGYQFNYIEEFFDSGERWGLHLTYSREDRPLGTAGAIKQAIHLIEDESFLVLNGDTFFDIDLNSLVSYHQQKGALASIALTHVDDTKRYGLVESDNRGEIIRFLEKTDLDSGWINGGIYVLHRNIIEFISNKQTVSLEREVFPKLIGKGFYGLPFHARFIDMGTPEAYRRLQAEPGFLISATSDS